MRNMTMDECLEGGGKLAESGDILRVRSTDIQRGGEVELVYGFVDKESGRWVRLSQGRKAKTLCGGSSVVFRNGKRMELVFADGEVIEPVDGSCLGARLGDLKKASGEIFGINALEGIELLVL